MVPRTAAAGGDEQSYRPLDPGPGTQIPPRGGRCVRASCRPERVPAWHPEMNGRVRRVGILTARGFAVGQLWVWAAGQKGGDEILYLQVHGAGEGVVVKRRSVCFQVSWGALAKSYRVLLFPSLPPSTYTPQLLRQPLEFSSQGSHQGQRLQRCYNFFLPLGRPPDEPWYSQIRCSFPTFFERKCPRCLSKTCLCRSPRAQVQAACRSQSTGLCEHTRTHAVLGFRVLPSCWGICTCNFKSFLQICKTWPPRKCTQGFR